MEKVSVVVTRDDIRKLPEIMRELQKILDGKQMGANAIVLTEFVKILIKSCGIKVGNTVDPDPGSRGKAVTMFESAGIKGLAKEARDTTFFSSCMPFNSREYAEGANIRISREPNRFRISLNIIHDRFIGRIDQMRKNPIGEFVTKKIDEAVKKK